MFKADGTFKHGYTVEIVRIIPRKVASRVNCKTVLVSGILCFFQNRIRKLSFRKSNEVTRPVKVPFDGLLLTDELMAHVGTVKTVQGAMAERMAAEFHAGIAHFLHLVPV